MSTKPAYKTEIRHMPEPYYDLPFFPCFDLAIRLASLIEEKIPSSKSMSDNGYTSISYLLRCSGTLCVLELKRNLDSGKITVVEPEMPAIQHWVGKYTNPLKKPTDAKIEALKIAIKKVTDLGFPNYQPRPISVWEKDLLLLNEMNFFQPTA